MRRKLHLVWYAVARGAVEAFCRLYCRVEVRGREHVPAHGAYVIAPVHRSNVDTLLAGCLTHRRIRFMGKDTLWKYRWSAALFSSLGAFPVHRGTPDREALRVCEAAVRAGEPVVLFPEGTRQSGPTVQPLFEGAAFVAARAGVPILPVGIGGSEWAMPKGQRRIVPVKVVMVGRSTDRRPAAHRGGPGVPAGRHRNDRCPVPGAARVVRPGVDRGRPALGRGQHWRLSARRQGGRWHPAGRPGRRRPPDRRVVYPQRAHESSPAPPGGRQAVRLTSWLPHRAHKSSTGPGQADDGPSG